MGAPPGYCVPVRSSQFAADGLVFAAPVKSSVQSVVQRGLGDDARLVMVLHEAPESAFYAALDEIAALDFLRAAPRAIRVIEEHLNPATSSASPPGVPGVA